LEDVGLFKVRKKNLMDLLLASLIFGKRKDVKGNLKIIRKRINK